MLQFQQRAVKNTFRWKRRSTRQPPTQQRVSWVMRRYIIWIPHDDWNIMWRTAFLRNQWVWCTLLLIAVSTHALTQTAISINQSIKPRIDLPTEKPANRSVQIYLPEHVSITIHQSPETFGNSDHEDDQRKLVHPLEKSPWCAGVDRGPTVGGMQICTGAAPNH